MIPAKLTGKPFWNMYLFQDPPMWMAYIDCARFFNIDAIMDCHVDVVTEIDGRFFGGFGEYFPDIKEAIIIRKNDRIITQKYRETQSERQWLPLVSLYYIDNPPDENLHPSKIGLPDIPSSYEDIEVRQWPKGEELLKLAKEYMGDQGIVGTYCGLASFIGSVEQVYDYYDNPQKYMRYRDELIIRYTKRFEKLMSFDTKPDFIATGSSGALVFQTPEMFRELTLPIIKNITSLCKRADIPTHLHCCGPEKELVRLCAEETELTLVDPLEVPPMGDCVLRELKQKYGGKLILKGNLHTTDVMLFGTPEEVAAASRKAIDDAAEGGGFILSTGDQCGRDTPFENIRAMVDTARSYGRYDKQGRLAR